MAARADSTEGARSGDARAVVRRFYEAFNAGDLAAYRDVLDEDVEVQVDTATLRGRDAVCAYVAGVRHTFPGIVAEPQRTVASDGGTVVVELRQVNPEQDDPRAWRLAGTVCEVITVRAGRVAAVRSYYLPHPDDRTAVAQMPSRNEAYRLSDEQDALRGVATLVAEGASEDEVFVAVSQAIGRIVSADSISLFRFEHDDTMTLLAAWSVHDATFPIGERRPLNSEMIDLRDGAVPYRYEHVPNAGPFVEEARALGIRSGVGVPVSVDGRVWGIVFASSVRDEPFPADTEARILRFTELVATSIANTQARAAVQRLADEQAALRRVAELVARGAPNPEVLDAVVREAHGLLGAAYVALAQYGPDGLSTLVAIHNAPYIVRVGDRQVADGLCIMQDVRRSGRSVRIDNYEVRSSQEWARACELGIAGGAAAPILVEGALWGSLAAMTLPGAMPVGIEARLEQFADIVGAAISDAQARRELRSIASEQAALRRVAELVAGGVPPAELLDAVVVEASNVLDGAGMSLLRFEPDGSAVVVATHRDAAPVGLVVPSEGAPWAADRLRTGRALRVSGFEGTPAEQVAREYDVRAAVVAPIMVQGDVWGMISTSVGGGSPPPGTEERIAQFAALFGTAVANAESRAELTASRARVVAAADESRRRLQRDVHDGAQQRLVQAIINLKLARQALEEHPWPAAHLIEESLLHAERASGGLRDLVRGILPAALTRGGLRAGVESLCADLPLAVDLDVTADRLPAALETTAYFVVAEALTNVVKHARATSAAVTASVDDTTLTIEIRDDGVGGADAAGGSGLTGLFDRVQAGEGTLVVESPAGEGTTIRATLPLVAA